MNPPGDDFTNLGLNVSHTRTSKPAEELKMDRNLKESERKNHSKNYFIVEGNYPALRLRISI
jgi:hypothetical protein